MEEKLLQAKLNGTWHHLPTPAPENYNPTYTHLERSYRDANGKLHRDIKRKNLAKVECGWNSLDGDTTAFLQSLYDYESFELKFTDKKNRRVIKTVYAGPLSGQGYSLDKTTLEILLNTGLSMNFIEV